MSWPQMTKQFNLEQLRERAVSIARDAKCDKPLMRYGIRNWPVRLQPFDEHEVPGVMVGGYNAATGNWEPLVHLYGGHVTKLEAVLTINGVVPNQDKWEEVNADGVLGPPNG
jgi:hypothetical protein